MVWNIFYDFPYIGNFIIPTDKLIFFRGVGWNHQPDTFQWLPSLPHLHLPTWARQALPGRAPREHPRRAEKKSVVPPKRWGIDLWNELTQKKPRENREITGWMWLINKVAKQLKKARDDSMWCWKSMKLCGLWIFEHWRSHFTIMYIHITIYIIIEGSLEVKLPTIWTDEKQSREEAERRGRLEERRSEEKE